MMSLGIFGGCNTGIDFDIGYDNKGGFGQKKTSDGVTMDILEFVSSQQELKDLCNEWNNPSFQEDSEYYMSEYNTKIRSYSDQFFNDKILIIYSFWRGYEKATRVKNITIDGTQIIINARYISKKGTFDSVSFNWLILIELNKLDVIGATTIQINHK